MKRALIATLLIILALASLVQLAQSVAAQAPTPPTTVTPTAGQTPTPTLGERYGKTILERMISPIVVLIVGGVLGAIATVVFKPHIEHWAERRRLRLQAQERERQAQQQNIQRRQIEDERLRAYLDRVAADLNTTRIFIQDEPVPLDEIYTDVYILSRPEAIRRFGLAQLRADPGLLERAERKHGRDFLAQPEAHRLFILGKPGAGKTTFLRYLARQAATGAIDKIPVLVTLREWADADQQSRDQKRGGVDLLAFIVGQFGVPIVNGHKPTLRTR